MTTTRTATEAEAETTSAAGLPETGGRADQRAATRAGELFAQHGATVLGLCRVLLRDPDEAEDAVQQTFFSAYRSLLRGTEPRHPAAWLATIARNECWAHIQRRMREPLAERPLDHPLPDPVAAAAAQADLSEIWCAIGELPRRQRRVFLLREFSGLSYAEVGQALGLSEPAVESLLVRARRQLRIRLRPVLQSTVAVAPLVVIRNQLSRLVGDMSDSVAASSGGVARVAAVPLAAKLAAGAAAVVVAGGTVAAVEHAPPRKNAGGGLAQAVAPPRSLPEAVANTAGTAPPAAQPAAAQVLVRSRLVVRSARPAISTSRRALTTASPTQAAALASFRPAPHAPAAPPRRAPAPASPTAGTPPTEPATPGTTAEGGEAQPTPAPSSDPTPAPVDAGPTSPDEGASSAAGGGESGTSGPETTSEETSSDSKSTDDRSDDHGGDAHDDGGSGGSSGGDD